MELKAVYRDFTGSSCFLLNKNKKRLSSFYDKNTQSSPATGLPLSDSWSLIGCQTGRRDGRGGARVVGASNSRRFTHRPFQRLLHQQRACALSRAGRRVRPRAAEGGEPIKPRLSGGARPAPRSICSSLVCAKPPPLWGSGQAGPSLCGMVFSPGYVIAVISFVFGRIRLVICEFYMGNGRREWKGRHREV